MQSCRVLCTDTFIYQQTAVISLVVVKVVYCLFLFSCLYRHKGQAHCPGHTPQLSGLSVYHSELVDFVSLLVVNERKKGLVAIQPPCSELELVPRYDPIIYQLTGQ